MSGPAVGDPCLAFLGGAWKPSKIHRVNEDGTFTVAPDQPDSFIMKHWHGVTRLELSFDDRGRWERIFPAKAGPDGQLGCEDLHRAFGAIGIEVGEEPMRQFWAQQCEALFGLPPDARLDAEQGYAVARAAGTVARRLDEGTPKGDHWFRMYWNQCRMGGRDPDDVGATVTLDDALEALGLARAPDDPDAVEALAAFEATHGLRLPAPLAAVARKAGLADAVNACHCNSPELIPPSDWTPSRGRRTDRIDGDIVIDLILPHQGEHRWSVAFDEGDADARVCLTWTDADGLDQGLPMAPSLALFLWDLAQTGACWYQEVDHEKRAGLRRTALGWAREPS